MKEKESSGTRFHKDLHKDHRVLFSHQSRNNRQRTNTTAHASGGCLMQSSSVCPLTTINSAIDLTTPSLRPYPPDDDILSPQCTNIDTLWLCQRLLRQVSRILAPSILIKQLYRRTICIVRPDKYQSTKTLNKNIYRKFYPIVYL